MNKVPTYIITIRYIIVAGLLYALWIGDPRAVKIILTIVIFHSEFLYIANRLKEAQLARQANAIREALIKKDSLKTSA